MKYSYIHTCALYTIYNHIFALQVIDANENRQESYHAASENLEEKTKQVNSLQGQLKDLEHQYRNLQEKLENVYTLISIVVLNSKDLRGKLWLPGFLHFQKTCYNRLIHYKIPT